MRISACVNCKSAYALILPHDSACDSVHDLERKMEFRVVVTILLALIDFWLAVYVLTSVFAASQSSHSIFFLTFTVEEAPLRHSSTGSPSSWKILPLSPSPNETQLRFALIHVLITCADLTGGCVRLRVNGLNTDRFECIYYQIWIRVNGALTKSEVTSFSIVALPLILQHNTAPNWTMSFWKAATKRNPGPVLSAHTLPKVWKLEQDSKHKQTVAYKQQRSSRNKNSTATTDHHYGPQPQQDDVTPLKLLQLCQEFYDRELKVPNDKHNYIKQNRRHQSAETIWGLQHPISVELQGGVPPHLLATLSSPCCTPDPSPPRPHDGVWRTRMRQNSGIWNNWGKRVMPTRLWRIWD